MSLSKTSVVGYQGEQGFVTGSTITTESLPATPLLYAAYGTVWVVLILYVFVLGQKLRRVERELKDVTRRLPR